MSNFLTNVSVILNLSAPGAEKFVLPIALSYNVASSSAATILSSTLRPTLYDGLVSVSYTHLTLPTTTPV